jgi:hypothetical protein
MGRKSKLRILVPAALAGLLLAFAIIGLLSRGGGGAPASQEIARTSAGTAPSMGGAVGGLAADQSAADKGAYGDAADVIAAAPPVTAAAPSAHHLMRSGDLSLLVDRGTLVRTVDRIAAMAVGMGGYVMSSTVGSDSGPGVIEPQALGDKAAEPAVDTAAGLPRAATIGEHPYATLTLRVPERRFDAAVKRFASLGEVQSLSTSSEDVTSQFVDLKARLRHFRAVERRLVRFLAATENVRQMLAVQDRIDAVQLTIEQLSAQLTSLNELTTYGTVTVYLAEKGVPQAGSIDPSDTFAGTLWHSLKVLGRGARISALAVTAALPFIVVFGALGLAAWYVTRRLRRARRHAAPPTLPA